MKFFPLFSFLMLTMFFMAACGTRQSQIKVGGSPYVDPDTMQRDEIIHLPTGTALTRPELFKLLANERIVYIGEGHDNIYDHQVELEVVKNLYQRFPERLAVGFEMLAHVNQEKVDQWLAGELSEDDFIRLFAGDWSMAEFVYYREIFAFLKSYRIPVRALNVSRHEKMVFMREMKSSDQGGNALENPPQSVIEDPYQKQALQAMFAGHVEGHGDLGMFLKVHQLWEENMAETIAAYLDSPDGDGKLLVVIAGGFHVIRGYGLPRRVFQRKKVPYCVLLTHTPEALIENERRTMDVDFPELPLYLGDYLWCVPYRNLKDQQARLGVGLKGADKGIGIVMVEAGSVAEKHGLAVGDLIINCAGDELDDPLDLSLLLLKKHKGEVVELLIERDGKLQNIEVLL
ncbi:MAG: ChaN family lipoprotein [Deltaproteobacteria bacterium]|nr:ChaN family lipoprotein [Deltaproteobacteria bacterium]